MTNLRLFFFLIFHYLPQDLKQPYHLLNKNNEELKRLAAVESLMEVSAEENVSFFLSRDTFVFFCVLLPRHHPTAFRHMSVYKRLNILCVRSLR
jgi:hypothetical protein